MIKRTIVVPVLILCLSLRVGAQEQHTARVIAVTLNTSSPAQLAIDRGRLIWGDTDVNTGRLLLKYYWGGGIALLDSGLTGLTCAISGDWIVWNTASQQVKAFDCRSLQTTTLGPSYNPDAAQPISISGDIAVYSRRNAGSGTSVVLHRFSSATDTLISAGTWNTAPSVHQGEVAWVVSDSESGAARSNIWLFDGRSGVNISRTTGIINRAPIARDGEVAWLSGTANGAAVKLYTRDSVVTVAQSPGGSVVPAGYDLSDGIAVAALTDTSTGRSTIRVFNTESGLTTTLPDSNGVTALHVSNGLVSWQSGTGPGRRLHTYDLQTSVLEDIAGAENPVIDHDLIAWTYGDAVEMRRPVTYTQMTTDGQNGWEQTKFKTIDSGRVVWGNFAQANHARLFWSDGNTTRQLTDSSVTHDLLMVNAGYAVWRSNFDSMYYYDGVHPPVKFLDTVQAENPYVAGGFISFNGLRLNAQSTIKYAWLYNIATGHLTQLTTDSANTENVMCEGNTACWLNAATGRLMFYDGASTVPLSDSLVDAQYSYRNGRIAWCERRAGFMQVMTFDVSSKATTMITSGPPDKAAPLTDGRFVSWIENPALAGTLGTGLSRYYDIATGKTVTVPLVSYRTTSWNWMSDGAFVWVAGGNVFEFDGSVVSQITNDDFNINAGAYLDRGTLIWQRTPPPSTGTNGQIFAGKLIPHPSFDAAGISGPAPLTVSFTNRSWEVARSYAWDFGDGSSATIANPSHTYVSPGEYTVTLTVSGPEASARERKFHLVRASGTTSAPRPPAPEPLRFVLDQNYPNPFNPSTVIGYSIPSDARVRLRIIDVLGRTVATLVDAPQRAGSHTVRWDAGGASSGVYFCALEAGGRLQVRKLVVMR